MVDLFVLTHATPSFSPRTVPFISVSRVVVSFSSFNVRVSSGGAQLFYHRRSIPPSPSLCPPQFVVANGPLHTNTEMSPYLHPPGRLAQSPPIAIAIPFPNAHLSSLLVGLGWTMDIPIFFLFASSPYFRFLLHFCSIAANESPLVVGWTEMFSHALYCDTHDTHDRHVQEAQLPNTTFPPHQSMECCSRRDGPCVQKDESS